MATGTVWEGGVNRGSSVDIKVGSLDIVRSVVMRVGGMDLGGHVGSGLRGGTIGDRLDHGDLRVLTTPSAPIC